MKTPVSHLKNCILEKAPLALLRAAKNMRAEYRREDLGKGVRGKHHAAFQKSNEPVAANISLQATEFPALPVLEITKEETNRVRLELTASGIIKNS